MTVPLLVPAAPVFATNVLDCSQPGASATDVCKEVGGADGSDPIIHIIKAVINIVSYIAGAAVIIELIVSGIKIAIANGDSNAIASARNGIIYSLIGVAVILIAQSIVVFVLNKL